MSGPLSCFKEFVPYKVRIGLFIAFAIVFQFANVTYLNLTGDMVGAYQLYKEDISFAYQVSTIGVTFIFPLLFRIKFRFTSQQILVACSVAVAILMVVCSKTSSMPLLIICAFCIGVLKMIGTFETLVSIQLIITPNKDYGVFFSVALGIILLSGQVVGTMAIALADSYQWMIIYRIVMLLLAFQAAAMLLVMRPFRMNKMLPLYGIDWVGFGMWSMLFCLISYVTIYGQVFDWFASKQIVVAALVALIFTVLITYRTFFYRRALLQPKVFALRNVCVAIVITIVAHVFLNTTGSIISPFTSGVMRLDSLHTGALNWWIAAGILIGGCFGYWWFTYINGPFRFIFGLGFAALTLHHALLYFAFSNNAGEQQLYLPYLLKGFGNIVLFAAAGKYMTIGVDLKIFTQVLCYMAMFRNVLGSVIMGSVFSNWTYRLSQNYLQKLAAHMDALDSQKILSGIYNRSLATGMSNSEATSTASKTLYLKVSREAVMLAGKDIFGCVTVFGIMVLIVISLYHFASPFAKQMPSWKAIFNGVRRQAAVQGD
jgi:hypothetical protein